MCPLSLLQETARGQLCCDWRPSSGKRVVWLKWARALTDLCSHIGVRVRTRFTIYLGVLPRRPLLVRTGAAVRGRGLRLRHAAPQLVEELVPGPDGVVLPAREPRLPDDDDGGDAAALRLRRGPGQRREGVVRAEEGVVLRARGRRGGSGGAPRHRGGPPPTPRDVLSKTCWYLLKP